MKRFVARGLADQVAAEISARVLRDGKITNPWSSILFASSCADSFVDQLLARDDLRESEALGHVLHHRPERVPKPLALYYRLSSSAFDDDFENASEDDVVAMLGMVVHHDSFDRVIRLCRALYDGKRPGSRLEGAVRAFLPGAEGLTRTMFWATLQTAKSRQRGEPETATETLGDDHLQRAFAELVDDDSRRSSCRTRLPRPAWNLLRELARRSSPDSHGRALLRQLTADHQEAFY